MNHYFLNKTLHNKLQYLHYDSINYSIILYMSRKDS